MRAPLRPALSFAASFAALLAGLGAQSPTPTPKPINSGRLDLELLLDWETVSDPKLSPDGQNIVFTRQWTDKLEDKLRSELWLMQSDGSNARCLAQGGDARWSPDSKRIAYLADGEPKGPQIWVVNVFSREKSQLTHVTEAPSNLRWNGDEQLICTMVVPAKDGFPIELPKPPKGAKWIDDAKVITRLSYRADQQGYRPAGYRHLFAVDAFGGAPRQLTSGDFDHGTWSSGYFDGLRTADADWQVDESELYHLGDDGTITQVTTRRGPDRDPLVAGDDLYWLGYDHTGSTHDITRVYAMHLPNGAVRCLTKDLDRSIARMVPARLGAGVLCQYEDQGAIRCARLLPDGTFTPLTPGDVQFAIGDESNNGTLVGVLQSPKQPPQIALRSDDGSFKVLTHVNRDLLHGRTLGKVEPMTWKGADGWDVQGWLVLPPDFDAAKKYPLMLQIHGGPHSMYGVNFDFERQNHAANGYLVLYCNPRGSTGYGERFARGIQNAYPGKDYDDLMAGVDAVIARGCVDTDNLFVYGGSGGGVLTAWTIGSTQRFRAAVSMFPVIDWISFVGTTDGPFWYSNFAKLPWEDITEHWQRSPLRLVGNVTTPCMLITGELDLRTPMAQTEEYYQALKLRKVDTVLVRVQDEYHGASTRHPSNRMRRILYVRTWFEQHKAKAAAK